MGATEDSRRATSLPSPLVSASLSLVVSHVPFSLLVRAWCLTTDDVRFVMMWISFLINLFVVKGRRFVKGAQILAADFSKNVKFCPKKNRTPTTKNESSQERRGICGKKNGTKRSRLVSQKSAPFSKSSKSRKEAPLRFPETVFGREGVNDVEKRLRWSSYAAARVLYSTFLLHYLAVFGGVLDDHRHFCVWFLFYFPSLV